MGMLEIARDSLKDLPISDEIRERLSLALDQLADAQRQVEFLQTEKGGLNAQLERERLDHKQTQKELQDLKELMHEEVMFVSGVEFRKGPRTGKKWSPFCPKCHLPLLLPPDASFPSCHDEKTCGWMIVNTSGALTWPELKRLSNTL